MLTSNVLSVREFDTITCNEDYQNDPYHEYLDEKHFIELEKFVKDYSSRTDEADILDFMKLGFKRGVGNTITFNSNVGIIQLPSGFQIEILPKINLDSEDDTFSRTKRIFLDMLCCLKEFDGKSFNLASLNSDKMNLYEIFINMYLKETRNLVKHGIKSLYVPNEDNLRYFKGKLKVNDHIKLNAAHRERFFMCYDEYQVNRAENRLVKTTLLKLQKLTRSLENAKEIGQLLISFEHVEISTNIDEDFSKVSLGRDTKDYEKLIVWSNVFLRNKSLTTFSGRTTGSALLFQMERVFETFVANWISRIFSDLSSNTLMASAQDSGYYLFDSPRRFRLRPDIVIRRYGTEPVIMDTKWKRLKADDAGSYGISQSDMYQMYAYSKKYHTSDIWLLYPLNEEVTGLSDISFVAEQEEDKKVNVRVFFIDLADYKTSITELYNVVTETISQRETVSN